MKNDVNILQILNKPFFSFEKFHTKTKLKKFKLSTNSNTDHSIEYKGYARFEEFKLTAPILHSSISLKRAFTNINSSTDFSRKVLSLEKISNLLFYSAGLNRKYINSERRFYPSGSERYPLEVYLISLNSDLPKGIYHYYLKNHSLEKLVDFKKKELELITNLEWVKKSGCIIIITSVFKRNTMKYGDRGYRNVLVEAGHVLQNLFILSSALNIACNTIDNYIDDAVDKILDINGLSESTIGIFAFGEKFQVKYNEKRIKK